MDSYSREKFEWTLYKHTSPSGKVYIGITKQDVNSRWSYGSGYRPCTLFYRAIKKYGWYNIKHEILFQRLSFGEAVRLEKDLIRHYKALGLSYNITDGGEGCLGRVVGCETRNKQRDSMLGRICSPETKLKLSLANKGKPNPRKGKPGKKLSKEARDNIGRGHLGLKYKRTEEWGRKVRIAGKLKSKPVLQIDANTLEVIAEYPSTIEAAKVVNASRGNISNCCLGRNHVKTVKGFIWRFKN